MINYYKEIKEKLIDNEIYEKVKDFSKERNKVSTYFEIGKILNEAGKQYGNSIIKDYSIKLCAEVNKRYNERTLRRIRQFYTKFSDKKWSTLSTKLSWSHITELLPISNENKILYYLKVCINQNIDVRSLRKKIKSMEFERLPIDSKTNITQDKESSLIDLIKNPIIINNGKEIYSEKVLQKVIVENIKSFMDELGEGYSFIGNEYKIKIGSSYNYIDLLLFNYKFNCFVVIELKTVELKKEHIGQIEVYMNYIDKNVKEIYHDKTIGIIICKKNNKYIIEYASDKKIISREYLII